MERLSSACRDSERGDIVLGWITKLAVGFALAGIVLFDAMSVGTTVSSLADQGSYAAREASETWNASKDLQKAYLTASAIASESNKHNVIDPKTFRVDPDGRVHLTISRTATTLVLYRIGPINHLGEVKQDAQALSVS